MSALDEQDSPDGLNVRFPMKSWPRRIGTAVIGVVAIAAIVVSLATINGSITWFVRNRGTAITVDGKSTPGYLDDRVKTWTTRRQLPGLYKPRPSSLSSEPRLVTVQEPSRGSETYWFDKLQDGSTRVIRCGAWVAPTWPIFHVSMVEGPCITVVADGDTPVTREEPHMTNFGADSLDFLDANGRKVHVEWRGTQQTK